MILTMGTIKRIHSTFNLQSDSNRNISQWRIDPFKPLKLSFDDKLFVTAHNTLFSGTGKCYGNSGSIIKREDYSKGYAIIVADLKPSEIGDNFDLKEEGTLSIDLFSKVLLQLLSMYWFMQNMTASLKLIATIT